MSGVCSGTPQQQENATNAWVMSHAQFRVEGDNTCVSAELETYSTYLSVSARNGTYQLQNLELEI